MAVPVSFLEANNSVTDANGLTYPVWVRPSKLGKQTVTQVVSAWQMDEAEIIAVNDRKVVFIRVVGGQPPICIGDASPCEFEGQTNVYKHADCLDLPTFQRDITFHGQETVDITSAWELSPAGFKSFRENGGVVFLFVTGGQPNVEVFGINPIE